MTGFLREREEIFSTYSRPESYATKTEVVDVVSGETCGDLADFPLPNLSGMGANLHGTPVVCGGTDLATYYQSCYKFTINGWQNFTSMKEKRWAAAGVMYNDRFHVFGGVDGSRANIRLKTSELISIDGVVEYGPELPTAVAFHVITSINSTVSILSGGMISATYSSPLTWYFNHETGAFSTGPNLMEGRNRHGSATCVDKVTEEKIPIVTAGEGNNYVDLDSTELLINEQWQPGTTYSIFKKQHVLICFSSTTICHHFIIAFLFFAQFRTSITKSTFRAFNA